MGGSPITLVTSGGFPVTNTAYRGPAFTPVASGGIPATLVASGGMPVTLVNADNSLWVDGAVTPVSISGTPGAATVGTPYSFTPSTANGSGSKAFSMSGSLPAGLSFSSTTGAITGTPTTAATTSGIGITVTDASGSATLSGLSIVVAAAGASIGGDVLEASGAVGSLREGYKLSWGDDFTTLDILGPVTPRGKYFTVRDYLPGPRGSDTLLAPQYNTDPYHLGYNDANRGVPYGFNNLGVSASVLTLQARIASTAERLMFQGTGRYVVASMISTTGAVQFYPDAPGTGDIIIEARIKHSTGVAGWHPTWWLQSAEPANSHQFITADEQDFEGDGTSAELRHVLWGGVANQAGTGTPVNGHFAYDNTFHVWTWIISKDPNKGVELYKDDVLFGRGVYSANAADKLQRALISCHVDTSGNEAGWAASPSGVSMQVDWMKVWRRASAKHFKPLAGVADKNIPFGGSTTFVLPDAVTLWGDASVSEFLQSIIAEENEPGGYHEGYYNPLPPGVTYDAGTRTLTVAPTSEKAGRLNFVMAAKKAGCTVEPLRFAVNIGPVINLGAVSYTVGTPVSVDVYAACDCGVLVTNGTVKTKAISITGLPGWASYSDTTGLLTGTPTDTGTTTATINVTNSLGQTASRALTVSKVGTVTVFANDTFTDTDAKALSAHTAEVGGTWIKQPGISFANETLIYAGRLAAKSTGMAYQLPVVPLSADYQVDGVIDCLTVIASDTVGITLGASTTVASMYYARYVQGTGWQLFKVTSGTAVQVGATVAGTFAAGTSRKLSLKRVGATLTLYVDDVSTITYTDPSPLAGVGRVGVRASTIQGNATGMQITSIAAMTL